MRKSQHFKIRCIQRFITETDIEMALKFGLQTGYKKVLSEKSCLALIEGINNWIKEIESSRKKGQLKLRKIDA